MVAQPRAGGKHAGLPAPVLNPGRLVHVPALRPGLRSCDTDPVVIVGVAVLAHQGGWDEMLMVLTPIAVFALLLKLANSRAKAAQATQPPEPHADRRPEAETTARQDEPAGRPDEAATGEPRAE